MSAPIRRCRRSILVAGRIEMLSVRAIHSHYGRAHILDGLSFEVGRGEVLALLGRNGAGKSTTFKTIVGIVRASGGEIEFQGQRLERRPTHEIGQLGLGYVPEERR